MISIVIPLYNKDKQIEKTLESVFNQTFQNYEVVIVNDGSTDRSVEIVKAIQDPRLRLVEQKNQGVSAARNRGVAVAEYDYIAFLDADDEWKPTYLETQLGLIRSFPDCSVYGCAYEFKYLNKITPALLNRMPFEGEQGVLSNYFEVASYSHPPLWTSAVVVEKKAFLSTGGFPVGVIEGEDLITWAKLAVNYSIAYSMKEEAYFVKDQSENYSNEMPRIEKEKHNLGKEFETLLKENPGIKGLKKYVSHWYKMRASMFLLSGHKKNAWKEACKSLKFNILNYKVWFYVLLLPFSKELILKVFRKLGNA